MEKEFYSNIKMYNVLKIRKKAKSVVCVLCES